MDSEQQIWARGVRRCSPAESETARETEKSEGAGGVIRYVMLHGLGDKNEPEQPTTNQTTCQASTIVDVHKRIGFFFKSSSAAKRGGARAAR